MSRAEKQETRISGIGENVKPESHSETSSVIANVLPFGWRSESDTPGDTSQGWRVVRMIDEGLGPYDDEVVAEHLTQGQAESVVAECIKARGEAWAGASAALETAVRLIPDDPPIIEATP